MKYVMTNYGPVVFPEGFAHSEMAAGLGTNVTSAGFVACTDPDTLSCFGKSISLNLESIPESDTEDLRRQFRGY